MAAANLDTSVDEDYLLASWLQYQEINQSGRLTTEADIVNNDASTLQEELLQHALEEGLIAYGRELANCQQDGVIPDPVADEQSLDDIVSPQVSAEDFHYFTPDHQHLLNDDDSDSYHSCDNSDDNQGFFLLHSCLTEIGNEGNDETEKTNNAVFTCVDTPQQFIEKNLGHTQKSQSESQSSLSVQYRQAEFYADDASAELLELQKFYPEDGRFLKHQDNVAYSDVNDTSSELMELQHLYPNDSIFEIREGVTHSDQPGASAAELTSPEITACDKFNTEAFRTDDTEVGNNDLDLDERSNSKQDKNRLTVNAVDDIEFETFFKPFPIEENGVPSNWDWSDLDGENEETQRAVVLDEECPEHQVISAEFHHVGIDVVTIERVQNLHLLNKYKTEVQIFSQNRPVEFSLNEQYLFHGTSVSKAALCEEGLDLRLCRTGYFGRGIYFSDNPLKCVKYSIPSEHSSSACPFILKCRVLLGDIKEYPAGMDCKNLRREPEREIPQGSNHYYDAVKGRPRDYNEYVIYESRRALIDYIITYRIPDASESRSTSHVTDHVTRDVAPQNQSEAAAGEDTNPEVTNSEKTTAEHEELKFGEDKFARILVEESKRECRARRQQELNPQRQVKADRCDRLEQKEDSVMNQPKPDIVPELYNPCGVTEKQIKHDNEYSTFRDDFERILEETKKACRNRRRQNHSNLRQEDLMLNQPKLDPGAEIDKLLTVFMDEKTCSNDADEGPDNHLVSIDTSERAALASSPPNLQDADEDDSVKAVRDSLIIEFLRFTGTDDLNLAKAYIDNNDMDINKAVDAFLSGPDASY